MIEKMPLLVMIVVNGGRTSGVCFLHFQVVFAMNQLQEQFTSVVGLFFTITAIVCRKRKMEGETELKVYTIQAQITLFSFFPLCQSLNAFLSLFTLNW